MKVRSSVKKICDKCRIIRRKDRIMVICEQKNINNAKDKKGTTIWFGLKEPKSPAINGLSLP